MKKDLNLFNFVKELIEIIIEEYDDVHIYKSVELINESLKYILQFGRFDIRCRKVYLSFSKYFPDLFYDEFEQLIKTETVLTSIFKMIDSICSACKKDVETILAHETKSPKQKKRGIITTIKKLKEVDPSNFIIFEKVTA